MVSLVKMLGDRFQLLILYVTAMLTEAVRQLLTRLANVLFAAALTYDTVNQIAAGATELVLDRPSAVRECNGSSGINVPASFALGAVTWLGT